MYIKLKTKITWTKKNYKENDKNVFRFVYRRRQSELNGVLFGVRKLQMLNADSGVYKSVGTWVTPCHWNSRSDNNINYMVVITSCFITDQIIILTDSAMTWGRLNCPDNNINGQCNDLYGHFRLILIVRNFPIPEHAWLSKHPLTWIFD